MHVVFTGISEDRFITDYLRERPASVEFMESTQLLATLAKMPSFLGCADLILFVGHPDDDPDQSVQHLATLGTSTATALADQIAGLPAECATPDGRKWSQIPVMMLFQARSRRLSQDLVKFGPLFVAEYPRDRDKMYGIIRNVISDYRRRLLDDLSDLGWIVDSKRGKYTVRPAFGLTPNAESRLYYGPADMRKFREGQAVTVDRDTIGIQNDLEDFEALIGNPDVTEPQLQEFFESNPYFLAPASMASALPRVFLPRDSGGGIIPDFILKPIVAMIRDSNWEVLDLKRPQATLLAGRARHRRFSAEVFDAITQVKDYGDYFGDPGHAEAVKRALGHRLKFPRLGILIGRLLSGSAVEELEAAQAREQAVRVVTYDEILERQKQQLD